MCVLICLGFFLTKKWAMLFDVFMCFGFLYPFFHVLSIEMAMCNVCVDMFRIFSLQKMGLVFGVSNASDTSNMSIAAPLFCLGSHAATH